MALDVELVEANTPQSRVIEIGAVRFDEHGVVEEWSTLVNPGRGVPLAERLLTGIDDAALADAPTLEQVGPRLLEFVGADPLVGQSVDLDVAHLARQGVPLPNALVDTFELATLLLPGLSAYDLSTIARDLGVERPGSHRALADAHQARAVFLALLERIESFGIDVLMHVDRLTAGIAWPYRSLFLAAEEKQRQRLFAHALERAEVPPVDLGLAHVFAPHREEREPLVPEPHPRSIDADALVRALSRDGCVAATLSSYEERTEQIEMLRAVCDGFNRGRHLVVEAGTGTGKSLAYLLPALAYAAANDRRVVVSTNTINLQDQLYEKDIPDLIRAMDYRVRASVLKGRSNYLCLRRWRTLLDAESHSLEEARLLVKTLLWIGQTRTGDRAELRLAPDEEMAWNRICSQAETCSPRTCSYHREGACFVARARRAAERSHVVIVNHALLLSDLVAGSHVIPDYEHLVVDEAHHLEEEATAQLGYSVSARSFAQPLDVLASASGASLGSLDVAVAALRAAGLAPDRARELGACAREARAHATDALASTTDLFAACQELMTARSSPNDASTLRITAAVRRDGMWGSVEQQWEQVRDAVAAVSRAAGPILEELNTAAEAGAESMGDLLADGLAAVHELEIALDRVRLIVAEPAADSVCWISLPTGPLSSPQPSASLVTGPPVRTQHSALSTQHSTALHHAPLDVGAHLQQWLLEPKSTVVLTSATLSVAGSLDYIRERLGVRHADEAVLGSPFDFKRAALVFLPTDLPEPAEPGYGRRAADAVADVAEALGGRTLALFTSNAQLRATREMIRARMEAAQIVLMSQGVDGSRSRLLQRFKGTERALLLGTASFWEGVDVVGDALSALIIARLPFAVPTDPLFAARSEQFEEPFRQYAVPHAILRFKQGFGRLIRSQSDRGMVLVLDRRITSRTYGAMFLNSLPECTVRLAPIGTAGAAAREWLLELPARRVLQGG